MPNFFAIAASIVDPDAVLIEDFDEPEITLCEICRERNGSGWTGAYQGLWACDDCSWEYEHSHYGEAGRW